MRCRIPLAYLIYTRSSMAIYKGSAVGWSWIHVYLTRHTTRQKSAMAWCTLLIGGNLRRETRVAFSLPTRKIHRCRNCRSWIGRTLQLRSYNHLPGFEVLNISTTSPLFQKATRLWVYLQEWLTSVNTSPIFLTWTVFRLPRRRWAAGPTLAMPTPNTLTILSFLRKYLGQNQDCLRWWDTVDSWNLAPPGMYEIL